MSPNFINHPSSSPLLPYLDLNGDQLLGQIHELATCNNSNIFYLNFEKNPTNFDVNLPLDYSTHPKEIKVDKRNDLGQNQCMPSTQYSQNMEDGCSKYGYPYVHSSDQNQKEFIIKDQKLPRKWKSSKLKIMQKMTSNIENGNNNNFIRVCSDCHTTTTPLWRGGPQGPKSLCNACGIKQRKARRAALLATTTIHEFTKDTTNTTPMCVKSPKIKSSKQEKRKVEFDNIISSNDINTLPHKKRSKIIENVPRESCNNNSKNNIGLVNRSNKIDCIKALSQRTFLRDEEEGAFLLMALSCGFACSS